MQLVNARKTAAPNASCATSPEFHQTPFEVGRPGLNMRRSVFCAWRKERTIVPLEDQIVKAVVVRWKVDRKGNATIFQCNTEIPTEDKRGTMIQT